MLAAEAYLNAPHLYSSKNLLPPNVTPPGDYECIFFADTGFTGQSIRYTGPSAYGEEYVRNLIDLDFDNRMQSYMCGKNVMLDLCNAYVYAPPYGDHSWNDYCGWDNGQSAAGAVWDRDMIYGLDVSAIRLKYYDATDLGAVTVFQ